jgi:nitroreductase
MKTANINPSRRNFLKYSSAAAVFACVSETVCTQSVNAGKLKPIKLLLPQMDGGIPLMQALKERRTSKEFSNRKLPMQLLSNMLWAAFGINRPDSGLRTAPSAANWQEIDIYVATAEGLYLYDAKAHILQPVLGEDIRALTGTQAYVNEAVVNLIYVADFSRMERAKDVVMQTYKDDYKTFYSATDTGFISQNVYLFCASEGLATVVRGMIDRPELAEVMGLRPDQKIILAQSIGYPKN